MKQNEINTKVIEALNEFEKVMGSRFLSELEWHRLRSFNARVARVGKFYVLQSYNTVVAIIDTETDTLYDFLRYVYGYTASSAQHISKFNKDYGSGIRGCLNNYRFY